MIFPLFVKVRHSRFVSEVAGIAGGTVFLKEERLAESKALAAVT
jgi:hypothetical protein